MERYAEQAAVPKRDRGGIARHRDTAVRDADAESIEDQPFAGEDPRGGVRGWCQETQGRVDESGYQAGTGDRDVQEVDRFRLADVQGKRCSRETRARADIDRGALCEAVCRGVSAGDLDSNGHRILQTGPR